ncbi:hypothetical protein [Micromonospora rubida]|uniref:hypothetical protein n=1 Tax=Micromonospora rubida TaxID=2697657 RepID=UPI001378FE89|nr:hypothetical protein [Micromonospora rubida]NBE79706.1 hypothetical protein [Micromonospora rubida]
MTVVVLVNALCALLTAVFGIVGLVRPLLLASGEHLTRGLTYYAYAYGVRAVPLGIATIVTLATGNVAAILPLLITSGLVQAADSALGIRRRVAGMAISAGVTAAIHLGSAWWLLIR